MAAAHLGATATRQQTEGVEHRVELYQYLPPPDHHENDNNNNKKKPPWSAWKDMDVNANLLRLADANLVSKNHIVPIGVAHRQGLLHRGLWMAVLRRDDHDKANPRKPNYKVLLLERSSTLKTCPGAWGLVGEHSEQGESWKDTALRALSEELQLHLEPSSQQQQPQTKLVNLLPHHSILVRTDYTELKRRDLQATALFAIVLTGPDIARLQPDAEVASMQWVPIGDLLLDTNHKNQYCNPDISALADFVGRRLMELGYS